MSTILTPLHDNILILPTKTETKPSGILVIEGKDAKAETGTVVDIGPGRVDNYGKRIPITVTVGDVVAFQKASIMHEYTFDGVVYYLLKEQQITGIVRTK
jgi:chaperonin GroES